MFTWIDDYSMQIDEVDAQHKQLIAYLNQLFDQTSFQHNKDKIKLILDDLLVFTDNHFATERCYMEKYKYPDIVNHTKEHSILKEKLVTIEDRLNTSNFNLALEILLFIKQWLVIHLTDTDQKFYKYLKNTCPDKLGIFGSCLDS
jgi:hemerythrin